MKEDRKWALPTRPPGDLSPSVPLSGTPDGRRLLARNQPSPPSLPGPIRCPGGFPVGTGPTPLRCVTRTAGRNAGGFSGRHPGTAAGPRPGYPDKGFRRRGRRSPPATTGAGTETPPLGRKGRAEDNRGCASGDKRRGYARCGGWLRIRPHPAMPTPCRSGRSAARSGALLTRNLVRQSLILRPGTRCRVCAAPLRTAARTGRQRVGWLGGKRRLPFLAANQCVNRVALKGGGWEGIKTSSSDGANHARP